MKIIKSPWFFVVLLLILARAVILYLASYNIPYLGIENGSFFYGYSGDETEYFNSAEALLRGEFIKGAFPVGFSLLLLPFIWLLDARSMLNIIKPVIIMHSIFYIITVLLVYILAKKFLIKKYKALIISFFYIIYPYLFYLFFHFFAQDSEIIEKFKITRFGQLIYLLALSDPLSTILMLSSLLLLLKMYKRKTVMLSLLLGFITSWAVITRLQNAVIVPIYSIIFFVFRKSKNFIYFIIGLIPLGVFQLYANYKSNGSIFKTIYNKGWEDSLGVAAISIKYPLKIIEYSLNYSPLLILPLILISVLIVFGIYKLFKENKKKSLILASYFFSILFFISLLAPTFLNPRYFLPIIPAVLILGYAGIEQTILIFKKKYGKL